MTQDSLFEPPAKLSRTPSEPIQPAKRLIFIYGRLSSDGRLSIHIVAELDALTSFSFLVVYSNLVKHTG